MNLLKEHAEDEPSIKGEDIEAYERIIAEAFREAEKIKEKNKNIRDYIVFILVSVIFLSSAGMFCIYGIRKGYFNGTNFYYHVCAHFSALFHKAQAFKGGGVMTPTKIPVYLWFLLAAVLFIQASWIFRCVKKRRKQVALGDFWPFKYTGKSYYLFNCDKVNSKTSTL